MNEFDELNEMLEKMTTYSVKKLRQIAAHEYGVELGEAVLMDKFELLDYIASVEERNAVK